MSNQSKGKNIINWFFGILFLVIGIMNIIQIGAVPGMIYILISCIYLPPINAVIQKKISFVLPFALKVIFGLVILWATLGVGDLAELYGL